MRGDGIRWPSGCHPRPFVMCLIPISQNPQPTAWTFSTPLDSISDCLSLSVSCQVIPHRYSTLTPTQRQARSCSTATPRLVYVLFYSRSFPFAPQSSQNFFPFTTCTSQTLNLPIPHPPSFSYTHLPSLYRSTSPCLF